LKYNTRRTANKKIEHIAEEGLFFLFSSLFRYHPSLRFRGGNVMDIRTYQPRDEEAVVRLWDQCGLNRPLNDPPKDITRKLSEQPDLFLVGQSGTEVIATAMAGFDGYRYWVYYVAVSPEHQKESYGS
jgi:hypothetical protein